MGTVALAQGARGFSLLACVTLLPTKFGSNLVRPLKCKIKLLKGASFYFIFCKTKAFPFLSPRNKAGAAIRSQAVEGFASHCRCHQRLDPLPIAILREAPRRPGHRKLLAFTRRRPPLAKIRALQQNAKARRPPGVPRRRDLLVSSDTARGGSLAPPHHLRPLHDAFFLLQRVCCRLCPRQLKDVAREEVRQILRLLCLIVSGRFHF